MNVLKQRRVAGLAALLLLMSIVPFVALPAFGASVTPEFDGDTRNKTCSEFEGEGQSWVELKVDPNADGVFSDGTLTVTISNTTNDKSFDWSSNIGVDAVFVKAGAGGSNLYRYDPPSESTGDTNLQSPGDGGNAISHISFCYDIGTTTTTQPEETTTTTQPEETTTTTQPEETTTTTQPEETTTTTQPEETTTTTQPEETTTTTQPEETTTTTQPEETTTTTQPPVTSASVPGRIIVEKQAAGTESFAFDGSWADFNLAGGQSHNSGDLPAGTYSVFEVLTDAQVADGWQLTDVSCVSSIGDTEGNGGIELDQGETVTCTFSNVLVAGIQVTTTVAADTLPFTGFESQDAALMGLLVLAGGGMLLLAANRRDEEEAATPETGTRFQGWSR